MEHFIVFNSQYWSQAWVKSNGKIRWIRSKAGTLVRFDGFLWSFCYRLWFVWYFWYAYTRLTLFRMKMLNIMAVRTNPFNELLSFWFGCTLLALQWVSYSIQKKNRRYEANSWILLIPFQLVVFVSTMLLVRDMSLAHPIKISARECECQCEL